MIAIYLLMSFYFFKEIILFYFDNISALIFYIFISFMFILLSISKALKLFFDKTFLCEIMIIFVTLEVITIFTLNSNCLILVLIIVLISIFSDQYQKIKILISKSKLTKYKNENQIKEKFSKYCKINNIYVIESEESNAFTTGIINKDIYLTTKFIENLNEKEIEAIIAHEVGHHYHKHLLKIFILIVGYYIITCLIPNEVISTVLLILYPFYVFVILSKLQHAFEKEADHFAANITNKKDLISAIIKIAKTNKAKFKTKSVFHPSIEERIDYISKGN
jgi:STE24 endopeptidase